MFSSYKQLFTDLKAWGKVVVLSPLTRQQSRILDTVQAMGFVSVTSVDNGLRVTLLPQTIAQGELIQVSHWKTGHRAGKFSGATYKKVSRHGSWVTYQLTDTMTHVVPFKRTRKVQAAA